MQYLITQQGELPFYTRWYTHENCFKAGVGMVVYDLYNHQYTNDGEAWIDIEFDHL